MVIQGNNGVSEMRANVWFSNEFVLDEHMVSVDVCGTTYYATEDGKFTFNPDQAYTHFTHQAAKRMRSELNQDSPIEVSITVTNRD